ncbi:MAG: O-antigen ligase family protein [Bacteroidales bacterium]
MNDPKSVSLFLERKAFSRIAIMALVLLCLVLYMSFESKIVWAGYAILLVIIIVARGKFTFTPSIFLLLLSLPMVWGLIMSLDDSLNDILKGLFYFLVPVIMFFIGYQFRKIYSVKELLTAIIILGNIISLIFIFLTLYRVGPIAFISPYEEARFSVSSGSPASVFAFNIALFSDYYDYKLFTSRRGKYITLIINFLAIWLFASRTFWVMLFIFLVLFSIRTMKNKNLIVLTGLAFVIIAGIYIRISTSSDLSFSNSITYKFANAFSEIRFSEFKTNRDINTYYRGYEAYRSWETYSKGTVPELILGGGFGKLVDLKANVMLDGIYWRYIPITHNGFFFVLVKEGALGLIFNLVFFLLALRTAIRKYRSPDRKKVFLSVFLLGSIFSLLVVNYVDCGMYTMEMTLLLITSGYIVSTLYLDEVA